METLVQLPTSRMEGGPIVGIDLGTTNSLVAWVDVETNQPMVLSSREGRNLVPSVVTFEDGKPVVGYSAKLRKVRDASHTVFSVKRLLGRGLKDLQEVQASLPYKLIEKDGQLRIQVDEKHSYTAIEISAMILKELKAAAEEAIGVPVNRAVITVPAYFNDSQRQATRAAGRLAGLDVLRILNEPTAASLAYGLNRKNEGRIAVYDLGGGTFDISILKLHDGIFEVLSTNGNTALGGDDIDQAIVARMAEEIAAQFKVNSREETQLHAALIEAAESVKIAFSKQDRATFEVNVHGRRFVREWTLGEFETLARGVLERTREPCLKALKDAGIRAEDLSDVVMVGGPTRLGIVQQFVRELFLREPNTSVHPDEVVALGAAIQADILAGRNKEFLLLDVVPLSLGLETYGGVMSIFIPRNTRIPTVARDVFTTYADNQTGVDIHVLQGEREKVEDNRSLARFKLAKITPMPAGKARIEVTFLIDADGILNVTATDLLTGNEQSIEVKPTYGLSDEAVDAMLRASADYAEQDIEYRKVVDARNYALPILQGAERTLPDAHRLLSAEEAKAIELKIAELKEVLKTEDSLKIQKVTRQLNQVTLRLAEILMSEAVRGGTRPEKQ